MRGGDRRRGEDRRLHRHERLVGAGRAAAGDARRSRPCEGQGLRDVARPGARHARRVRRDGRRDGRPRQRRRALTRRARRDVPQMGRTAGARRTQHGSRAGGRNRLGHCRQRLHPGARRRPLAAARRRRGARDGGHGSPPEHPRVIGPADIRKAARVLDGVAHRTPVIRSRTLGEHVVIKPENLQRAGAFKFRGAYNKISSLPRGANVVAFSSGNHAQAVALASKLLGAHATILMPEDAPASKLAATKGYGADVVIYDRYTGDREEIAAELARERGAEIVPPYDDPLIMAGQGTAALELLEDAGIVDTLVTPLGGGGLLTGSAVIAKDLGVRRVVGVEPEAGNDWQQSFARGERVAIDVPRTIADGLQTHAPGVLPWEVAQHAVDDVVTVTDEQIVEAMRFLFERLKIVVEPSGAVGIAAVRAGLVEAPSVGIVLSGGNVDAQRFSDLIR